MNYWLTVAVTVSDLNMAEHVAEQIAASIGGHVVQVDREPPQGALIVGEHSEDGA
jgi:hypothetical protein